MQRVIISFFIMLWSVMAFAQDTELKLYRPFEKKPLQAPITITKTLSGQCWQQSTKARREDAWRCLAEGRVYDPCFVKQYSQHKKVICPQSPWVGNSVEITVATALDDSQHESLDMSRAYPWAIELTNGEHCEAVDSNQDYDGLPIRYHCSQQKVLIGHVQRCANTWKILQHGRDGVSTVKIARAWF